MSGVGKDQFQDLVDEIERLKTCLAEEKNKLKEIQDYYEGILAVMPGHVYWLDKKNVYLGCNDLLAQDAKLKSRQEIIGKTNSDLPWKDQASELNRLNKLVLDSGTTHTAEEYVVMPNGLVIYFSTKIPLCDKKGEVIGILGVSIDITERKKMEVALRRAKEAAEILNQAKTEFIANMSHDIHSPLKGIVGLAKRLEENASDQQYAHWIAESGEQIIELLQHVLKRIADEQFNNNEIHEDLFDLRRNLQGICNLVLPTVKLKNLELILEMDEKLPDQFITDGRKLKRVLLNLISNAIQFTEKGSITIQVKILANAHKYLQLQFSVSDTGIGIAEAIQARVFDKFYPAAGKGHGVGLYTAQNYVGLLGGEIKVESELGIGSHFYFTLPIKVAGTETIELSTKRVSQILIIEANIVVLQVIEGLAMQTGCDYQSTTDATQALKLLARMDFDLVITDVELPGFSCEELVRSLRAKENAQHKKPVPIIGLTTRGLDETKVLLQAGMNKIISKPLRLEMMQALIDEYLAN